MKFVSTETFVEKLDCDVYPITFIKFILNKRKILNYFSFAARDDFKTKGVKYLVDSKNCKSCDQDGKMLCRQHTSIKRVVTAERVAFDLDTNTFFYKNEIFRMVGKRLVIVYCPHPKLIMGRLTDEKIRKIVPVTIEDPNLTDLPNYKIVRKFLSVDLMDQNLKCWFNEVFSIVTIPEDRNSSNFCLITNS